MWTRNAFEKAVGAVADGRDVDWEALEVRVTEGDRPLIRELRSLAPRHMAEHPPSRGLYRRTLGLGSAIVFVVAATQALIGLGSALALFLTVGSANLPPMPYPVTVLVFLSAGAVLLTCGGRNRHAATLGGFFLVVASAFSGPLIAAFARAVPAIASGVSHWDLALPMDAFLPAVLFSFVTEFPRLAGFVRPQEASRRLCVVSWLTGGALLVANLLLVTQPTGIPRVLALVDRRQPLHSSYWTVLLALVLTACCLAVWKSRRVLGEERSRASWLLVAVAAGGAPMAIASLMASSGSPLQAWVSARRVEIGFVVYVSLLSIPISTAYLVSAHRVLDISWRAVGYFLVRAIMLVGACVPVLLAGGRAYVYRHQTISSLASDRAFIALLVSAIAGVMLIAFNAQLSSLLRRRFFDEQRDIRASLAALARMGQHTVGMREVVVTIRDEIERSLHPLRTDILLWDASYDGYVPVAAGHQRTLPASSAIVAIVAHASEPVTMDLEARRSAAQLLPEQDRQWLMDTSCRLVMPLIGSERSPVALAVLGAKRSELPYSAADRRFLVTLGATAAAMIEPRLIKNAARSMSVGDIATVGADEPALECERCGAIIEEGSECPCGGRLAAARLPWLLAGKFRLERRIGRGGMGVVYRALDVALDRTVAIKTLPSLSATASMRLSREARAMATLLHPHLAVLLGLETWRGVPILVMEYLHGGTLAARLRCTRLPSRQAVDVGLALALGLECMHRAGLVHGDVKPSNIAFRQDDTPKLLDFGLVQILSGLPQDEHRSDALRRGVMGTPAYLPPEAMKHRAADPGWDLWGLALSLYEAVAGINPMVGEDVSETVNLVAQARVPDIREFAPTCPADLAAFFRRALALDRRRRPASATTFRAALTAARSSLPTKRL